MGVTMIIGSRNRPDALVQTLHETIVGAVRDDTKILVCLDDDDQPGIDAIDRFPKDSRIIVSVKPREDNRGAKCDRALTEAPNDLYAVGHDAAATITPGWDEIFQTYANVFPDGIGVVCSGMENASFPTTQAVTKRWVELTGHIYCHDYPFWFIDHELDDLARMTGRVIYAPHLEIPCAPRRPSKSIRLRDLRFWCDYYDLAMVRRRVQGFKIIDVLECPDWQKSILRTQYVPVEARSLYVNHLVRENASQIEQQRGEEGEPDAGYLRAFELARQNIKAMKRELRLINQQAA